MKRCYIGRLKYSCWVFSTNNVFSVLNVNKLYVENNYTVYKIREHVHKLESSLNDWSKSAKLSINM